MNEVLSKDGSSLEQVLALGLKEANGTRVDAIPEHTELFSAFGLSSMEMFSIIVTIERAFDVVIGEEPDDFERIKTVRGLRELLAEKRLAMTQRPAC